MTITATDTTVPITRSRQILIVDDDQGIRGVLSQILEDEGHAVATAANGLEALEKLRDSTRPCVILLDLMMPVMNGWEFMTRRQTERTFADIPVVIISADQQAREKAAAIGAADCLEKPIDLNRLIDTVDRYCPLT